MKVLKIRWQRLLDERGRTCDRCGTTEAAMDAALGELRKALKDSAFKVVLEKKALSPSAFQEDPLQSNRIWIDGKPIDDWLSGTTGKSPYCSTCGTSDCRTLTLKGRTYEAVPAELIVKAVLMAAAREGCCPA